MNLRRATAWIGFLIGVAGLVLQGYLTLGRRFFEEGDSFLGTIVFFFTFYTILTNIMLVLIYLSENVDWRWLGWWRSPVTRGMMAGAIALVGVVNHLLLHHLQTFEGLYYVGEIVLHYVAPAWFVLWWLVFQPKGTLRWADLPVMLLPTLIWLIWAMARGAVMDEYPYPFLNATQLGYPGVALNCLFVFIGLLVIYVIVIALDGWLGRRQATRSA